MNNNINVQNYLSLGYVFLIILGIIKDVVYYGFLKINILDYANLSDILLSPIAFMTSSLKRLIGTIVLGVIIYLFYRFKDKIQAWFKKRNKRKKKDDTKANKNLHLNSTTGMMILVAYFFSSFFLGAGMGSGNKMAKRIENQDLKLMDTITFIDGTTDSTMIVGKTSDYVFFVRKDSKQVSISPVKAIKEIVLHKD